MSNASARTFAGPPTVFMSRVHDYIEKANKGHYHELRGLWNRDSSTKESLLGLISNTLGDSFGLKVSFSDNYHIESLYADSDDENIVYLEIYNGSLTVTVGTNSPDRPSILSSIQEAIDSLTESLPEDMTKVRFWFNTNFGPRASIRNIQCPSWDSISANYPGVSDEIDWLMGLKEPSDHGSMIFWSGVPGTGKTYAIRSLIRKWDMVDTSVIIDPEEFLKHASYMHNVLMDNSDKKILLVMEDAADFVRESSRKTNGGPVARLLNITDGLIGQGLKLTVLVTTNENIDDIDGAITRPGRCVQNVDFPKLTPEQSQKWLENHGVNCEFDSSRDDLTLAELYGMVNASHRDSVDMAIRRINRPSFGYLRG